MAETKGYSDIRPVITYIHVNMAIIAYTCGLNVWVKPQGTQYAKTLRKTAQAVVRSSKYPKRFTFNYWQTQVSQVTRDGVLECR